MATVKGGTSGGGCIEYITQEEKTEKKLIDGINCNPETAKEEMRFTKEQFNKTTGTEYHHFIQSFKPGETTPEQAHEIGKAFAQHLAGNNYQAVLATHIDRDHIHNHVVLNSVSFEDGKKFRFKFQDMWELKEYSNKLCEERGLSTVDFHKKPEISLTTAEYRLQEKGKETWKQDLREAIDFAKTKTNSVEEMQKFLKEEFKIEMKIQDKNLKFKHPDQEKFCKGGRLGAIYEKEALVNEFDKRENRAVEERGRTEQNIENVGGNEKQHIGNRKINVSDKGGTSNLDRQLLHNEGYSRTGQERQYETNGESNRSNANIGGEHKDFEGTGIERKPKEYAVNNSSSEPNKQQTHSRTEQPISKNEPSNIEHRENQPRSIEKYDLDKNKHFENSGNNNRSNSVGSDNLDSNNIVRNSSTEERTNQRISDGNNGLEGRHRQKEQQEKIEKLDELINTKVEKGKGVEIAKKVEFYSEKENQRIYIEERKRPDGKIEVRASKTPEPFELLADDRIKSYKNYTSFNEASSYFVLEKNYEPVRVQKTIAYSSGVVEKELKEYDRKDIERINEGLKNIQQKQERENQSIERKVERSRGMER